MDLEDASEVADGLSDIHSNLTALLMNSANLVKALARPKGHRGPRGVGHVMIDGATCWMRPRSPTDSSEVANGLADIHSKLRPC